MGTLLSYSPSLPTTSVHVLHLASSISSLLVPSPYLSIHGSSAPPLCGTPNSYSPSIPPPPTYRTCPIYPNQMWSLYRKTSPTIVMKPPYANWILHLQLPPFWLREPPQRGYEASSSLTLQECIRCGCSRRRNPTQSSGSAYPR